MAFTNEDRNDIIALTVGVWNAAPGATNLASLAEFFQGGGSIEQLTGILMEEDIFTQEYPAFLTDEEFYTEFVDNLLGADGDLVSAENKEWAVDFLLGMENSGTPRSEVILAGINELRNVPAENEGFGDAAVAFENKMEVADYFSVELEKSGGGLADLKAVVANVDETDESVTAAKEAADDATSEPGTTFTLTTGQDSFEGGDGNDTINGLIDGANNTLGLGDVIDGGDGNDTLNVTTDQNTVSMAQADISNVEMLNVNMDAAGAAPNTVSLNGVAYNRAKVEGASGTDASAEALTVDGANLATTVVLEDISDTAPTVNFTGAATGDSDSATVEVAGASDNGSDDNDLSIDAIETLNLDFTTASNSLKVLTADDAETLNVTVASGADTTLNGAAVLTSAEAVNIEATGNLTLGAVADLEDEAAITVSGEGDVDLNTLYGSGGDGNTVDASALTGGLTVTGSADTASITGGSGDDDITSGVNTTAIDAGAGDDLVSVADLDYSATDAKSVTGGDGTDTVNITDGTNFGEDYFNNVTGFEQLSIGGSVGSKYDLSNADFSGVVVDADISATEVSGITDESIDITASTTAALTLTLDDASGSSDSLTTSIEGAVTVGSFVAGQNDLTVSELIYEDIETVTLESNNSPVHTKGVTNTVTDLATNATTVEVTGNHALTVTGFSTEAAGTPATLNTSIETIDASESAGLIMGKAVDNAGISITGSGEDDTLLIGDGGGTVNGNEGSDAITLGTAGSADTIIMDSGDSQIGFTDDNENEAYDGGEEHHDIISGFATGEDNIDLGSFGFSGQAASGMADQSLTPAQALELVDGSTTEIEDFFIDTGVQRGVAVVQNDDFSNIGGASGDTLVFIDSDNDGSLDVANDDMLLLSGTSSVALSDFGF